MERSRSLSPYALASLAMTSVSLFAQENVREGMPGDDADRRRADSTQIPRTSASIEIDGTLDEAAWAGALVIELTTETNPGENVAAPVETFAYLIEDGTTLYVGFDARDPNPEEIRAYLRDRDSAWNDDFVGVVLDTFGDERRGFEFFANPLGVQMDLIMDDINRNESSSWDAIWDAAGTIADSGFFVEMAIPFSQLRFERGDGMKTWGVDALRFYPRANRVRVSNNSLDRGRNCYLCQLDKVQGLAGVEPGRDLEVVPTLTASRTDTREDLTNGPLVSGDSVEDLGVSVRWGITQDMTANLAINPDFSQVEADVPQLDVNNQFALFFPETRPFFLEGADFFSTPIQAVFTRTIADPDFGAKLTGRRGSDTYGVFAANDSVTNLLLPGPLESNSDSLAQSNDSLVGRYSWGFGQSSTISALVTGRKADDYSNHVAGFDGRYRINDQHNVSFQLLHSETEYPSDIVASFDQPDGQFGGDALAAGYSYSSRTWFANVNYRSLEPTFRADSGFVSRVDFERHNLNAGHIWQGSERSWWNQLRLGGNYNHISDQNGQLLSRNVQGFFTMQGPLQSFMQTGRVRGREFWDGVLYEVGGVFLGGQIRPRGGLNLSLFIDKFDQIDFANSRLGEQLSMQPSIEWNAGRHMLLRLSQNLSTLDAKDGANIFDARLTDLRMTWQFNIRSFLRLTVQRQHIERNLAMFSDDELDASSVTMGTQLLYSYKLNPQTVLFAGYSDNHLENDELLDLTRTDRTFFVKLSYAWAP